MVDRPGAGNSRSYKIRGYTRERHSAKPYARPSERKSVLETVKDFFSPSWLVDFFKGSRRTDTVQFDDNDEKTKSDSVLRDFEQSSSTRLTRSHRAAGESQVGNGQMGSMMFRPGYFSSALREHEPPNDALSSSKPPRTVGLSSASARIGESSTITRRSQEPDTRVPSRSRDEEGLFVSKETTARKEEEEYTTTSTDQEIEERTRSNPIQTSTPALFSSSANTKRPQTSFLGHRLEEGPVALSETPYRSVLMPSTESRPQPFAVPKNRPSFSLSAFGSPLPPWPSQSGGLSSTFYHGRTSFGGASSFHSSEYKRARVGSPSQGEVQQPVRKQIKPKPVTTVGSSGVTSQTAKRILEALESMSSPLIDARKIPTPPASPSASLLSFSPSKRKRPPNTSRTVGSPRSLQARFGGPPVQDLSAPQRASISGTRGKASTNPNTTPTSASLFSTGTTTIPTFSKPSMPLFTPTPLPISLSPSSSESKAGGKVKSARSSSHYTQRGKLEVMREEVVNPLPEVTTAVPFPLLNGKSLPTFSFSSASNNETTVATSTKTTVTTDNVSKTSDITKNNFKFSEPQSKMTSSSQPTKMASGCNPSKITFSFSNPEPVNQRSTSNFPVNEPERAPNSKNKTTEKITESNNNLLKEFAPPPGSWTCDTCLVSNRATDMKCIACQSAKPASEKTPAKKAAPLNNDLFQKFASPGSWSCDTCMISNKESDQQRAACREPKPGVKALLPSEKPIVSSGEDLMKKFAPPEGSWTCDTCMVTNKDTDSSCVACESVKPGDSKATTTSTSSHGVLGRFGPGTDLAAKCAPPAGSWNRNTGMIDNKAESSSCEACQTPKPGAKPSSATSSFGVSSSSMSDKTLAAKFAPPPGSWSCDVCLVDNKAENVTCVACETPKPGAKPTGGEQASSLPFQFGFKNSKDVKNKEDSSSASSLPFTFGAGNPNDKESTTQSVTPSLFSFGAGSSKDNKSKGNTNFGTSEKDDDKAQLPVTFRFGAAPPSFDSVAGTTREEDPKKTNISFGFGTVDQTVTSKTEETKVPSFSFGSKTLSEKDNASVGVFSFGVNSKEKPNSIAAAAAAGFLKVSSELTGQEKNAIEQSSGQAGAGMTIAAAAKAGMLKVPAAEEKKGDIASPPNVNLFSSASSPAKSSLPSFMPPDKTGSSGFSFTAPPSAPFTFGAAQTAAASSGGDTKPASSNVSFSFGAGSGVKVNSASSVPSTSATASSFSFAPNPLPVAKAGLASFGLQVSSAVPTTTAPAMPFSFTSPAGGAATTAASKTMQSSSLTPLASSGQSAAPQGLFSFGSNLITPVSGNSTSEPVKPFSFNAATGGSSMQQGFSFASAKPPASSLPFTFGGSASKSNFNFGAGFGASQPSSVASAANTPFVFGATAPSTASDETMDADGNNTTTTTPAGGLFASTGVAVGTTFSSSGSTGGFSFGSQTAVPSAGSFNFGAAQQSNTTQSAFAFGANTGIAPTFGANTAPSALAPAGGGGFDFSGAASNMASPGGFNFGGGGNTTPQGGLMFTVGTPGEQSNPAIPGRKYKKAVRRTVKR